MLDPAGRERREVRVLGEDLLRRDVLLELDEQAAVADPHMERIERLHLVQPLGRDEALAERRGAEVDEGVLEERAAEAAGGAIRRGRVLVGDWARQCLCRAHYLR